MTTAIATMTPTFPFRDIPWPSKRAHAALATKRSDRLLFGAGAELALLHRDLERLAVPREDVDTERDLSREEIALHPHGVRERAPRLGRREDSEEAHGAGVR